MSHKINCIPILYSAPDALFSIQRTCIRVGIAAAVFEGRMSQRISEKTRTEWELKTEIPPLQVFSIRPRTVLPRLLSDA
jgi:hypothetical protein